MLIVSNLRKFPFYAEAEKLQQDNKQIEPTESKKLESVIIIPPILSDKHLEENGLVPVRAFIRQPLTEKEKIKKKDAVRAENKRAENMKVGIQPLSITKLPANKSVRAAVRKVAEAFLKKRITVEYVMCLIDPDNEANNHLKACKRILNAGGFKAWLLRCII